MRINPKLAEAWLGLGFAYGKLERYNEAIEAYRHALRINPKDVETWNDIGLTYVLSGNQTAALDAVRELRRLDPAMADKLFNLIVPR